MKKTFIAILVCACTLLCSCGFTSDKNFYYEEMCIVLDGTYVDGEVDGLNKSFISYLTGAAVIVKREEASDIEAAGYEIEEMTAKDYLELYAPGLNNAPVSELENDLVRLETVLENGGEKIRYFYYAYKSEDAYWLVALGTTTDKFEKKREKFEAFADSVTFEEN